MVRKARETAQTEDTVTETTEAQTEAPNTDPQNETPEAGTADGGHKFNVGDTATVVRGKFRGQAGTIVSFSESDNQYAVRLESGTLTVLNAANLKAPVDSTISTRALVAVLAGFGQSAGSPDHDAALRIAAMLDEVAPGTSVKLNEALSA